MKKVFGKIVLISIIIIGLWIITFNSQETYWDKCDLANVIGDFENSELIAEDDDCQTWIVEQYDSNWIVKIEDGHLISKTEI